MQTPWIVDVTDEILVQLDQYPYGAAGRQAQRALEKAINTALDLAGWPEGPRGEIPIPISYWYVNIWNRDSRLKGHVGPITDAEQARRVAKSWRDTGCRALRNRRPLGIALTNPGLT